LFKHEKDMVKLEAVLKEAPTRNAMARMMILLKGFEVAFRSKGTLDKGMEYLRDCVEILKKMYHPDSTMVESRFGYLKDPSSYSGFLCIDKKRNWR